MYRPATPSQQLEPQPPNGSGAHLPLIDQPGQMGQQNFEVLDIADASSDEVATSWQKGDIILFRAWYWNSDCQILENFQTKQQ